MLQAAKDAQGWADATYKDAQKSGNKAYKQASGAYDQAAAQGKAAADDAADGASNIWQKVDRAFSPPSVPL